jgi:FtsP/CotA-like multicopper oxidase with cupredoxin domain
MKDMGMGEMDHSAIDHGAMDHSATGHGVSTRSVDATAMTATGHDHGAMPQIDAAGESNDHASLHVGHSMSDRAADSLDAPHQGPYPHPHLRGPGVASVASSPMTRLHERPLGLENEAHRVLVYTDLRSAAPRPDLRAPGREMELHLTGNMERYMWSFDGVKFSEVDGPIVLKLNERVRLWLVNDTMMPHPIHLHGMFFDVVTGEDTNPPRKHTLLLKPGERAAVDVTADAIGDWAFHCHLLYHMHAGMMRIVSVREDA